MKISRNDYCPCGSGKKYKKCCMDKGETAIPPDVAPPPRLSKDDLADLDPAHADVMSPDYWEKMSKRMPRDMRKEFGPMLAQVRQYAEMESRRAEIEAAAEALEPHRKEYAKLSKNTSELLRRAEKLFAEPPFETMRFRGADIQRAFEAVGYPPGGPLDKRFAEVLDKAVRHMLSDKQREKLAQRLLLTLPEYVKAGRFMDAWIIRHSVDLTAEPPKGVVGPFLLAMFMHGYREWDAKREQEQMAMFAEVGLNPDEIRRMDFEGLEAWLRDMRSRPAKAKAMEKFLAQHPELNAMTQAQCSASEDAALGLLKSEDGLDLLLSPLEVRPWLDVLKQRLRAAPEGFASLSNTRPPDEKVAQAFVDLLYDVATEMAGAIFTPARLAEMKARLQELRGRFSNGDDPEALAGIHGAFMAMQTANPGDSHFLVTLCWMSLREAMEALGPTEDSA